MLSASWRAAEPRKSATPTATAPWTHSTPWLALWDSSVRRPRPQHAPTYTTPCHFRSTVRARNPTLGILHTPPHPTLSHHRSVALRLPNTKSQATSGLAAHCSSTRFSNPIVVCLTCRPIVRCHPRRGHHHTAPPLRPRAMRPCPVHENRVAVRRLG